MRSKVECSVVCCEEECSVVCCEEECSVPRPLEVALERSGECAVK